MPQEVQKNTPVKLCLDKSPKILEPDEAFYLLNHDVFNPNAIGKSTPFPSNYPACDIEFPEGENYVIGSHRSPVTNELYSFVYNSNGVHYIQRLNGQGICEIVYVGDCLNFSADPQHSIENWRVYLRVEKICKNRHGKQLIWTDGLNEIGCLDVEASINTNFFRTPFFDICPDECAPAQLCVPTHCGCIEGEFVELEESQIGLANHLLDVGIKVAYRHVYYDLRASEYSDISTLFFQNSKGCFDSASGRPRCLRLKIPIGNPLVDKIELVYSVDSGATWFLSDTIEKYESYTSAKQYWYERELSGELQLDEDGCSFYYNFCNDKQCQPVVREEVYRVFNPMPRQPQGLLNVKDLTGFYNYIQGTCPINKNEIDKFKIEANCDVDTVCPIELVDVKVRAIVHNKYSNKNTPVLRNGGTFGNPSDDKTDPARFDFNINSPTAHSPLKQEFAGDKRNFTVFVEGTNFFGEMKQWKADTGFINRSETGIVSGLASLSDEERIDAIADHDFYWFQEYIFRFKKGTKGFIRLESNLSSSNTDDTSTFLVGTLSNISVYEGQGSGFSDFAGFNSTKREIYFDTTSGSQDLLEAFAIEDGYRPSDSTHHSSGTFFGYLKLEDGTPIEGAEIWTEDESVVYRTDHNGFYYLNTDESISDGLNVTVRVELTPSGGFTTIKTLTLAGGNGNGTQNDIIITNAEAAAADYDDNYFSTISITVKNCDLESLPVAGVVVALSGSKYEVTNATGQVNFKIRNYSTRDRVVRAVLMDKGGCFDKDCFDDCSNYIPAPTNSTASTYNGTPAVIFTNLNVNDRSTSLSNRGLKKNGRFGFGVVVKFGCGKISPVYPIDFLNIPSLQHNGNYAYCNFGYKANNISLPLDATCLEIVRTENLNTFQLQWVVDKVERLNGKIKLTIQSLNDYNSDHNFNTNTVYQYVKGDRVEFIKNGDGAIFDTATYGLLNYLTISPFNDQEISGKSEADYFNQILVEDDNRLDGLTKGAVIELQHVKQCVNEPAYFGICVSLPVVNGQVVDQQGTFETFDTYLVNRIIGESYLQTFESKNPSDFWGDSINGISDIGKPYFVNEYENEKRYADDITFNAANQINYFGNTIKHFNLKDEIVFMSIVDDTIILAITLTDSFLAQSANDLVKVGSDNVIRAIPSDSIISDAQQKIRGQFGCAYNDIGGIFQGDGYVSWEDTSRNAYVKHDYTIARDVSIGKTKSYFKKRSRDMQATNVPSNSFLNYYRKSTGINRLTGMVFLTTKQLSQPAVYNEIEPYLAGNDTILYHPDYDEWFGFASHTMEHYNVLDLHDDAGAAFVSFFRGIPYIHPIVASSYNEFCGVACDRVVGVSINKFPDKVKTGVSFELQDEVMWFVKKVVCDNPTFISEIPAVRIKKDFNKWNASFLANKNSRDGLYGRELARGYYVGVTFIRDNTDGLKYNTINPDKQRIFDELDGILFKFMVAEQSGFTNNL